MVSHSPVDNGVMHDALWCVSDWLDGHNVGFWLDCGVLLGAVYVGDFIDDDYDIDLGLYMGSYPVVKELVGNRAELPSGLHFQARYNRVIQLNYGGLIMIDLCFFDKVRWMDHYEWQCQNSGDYMFWHPGVHLDRLEKLVFLGREFSVPYRARGCLVHHYGPDIQIPRVGGYDWHKGYNVRRRVGKDWIDNEFVVAGL